MTRLLEQAEAVENPEPKKSQTRELVAMMDKRRPTVALEEVENMDHNAAMAKTMRTLGEQPEEQEDRYRQVDGARRCCAMVQYRSIEGWHAVFHEQKRRRPEKGGGVATGCASTRHTRARRLLQLRLSTVGRHSWS